MISKEAAIVVYAKANRHVLPLGEIFTEGVASQLRSFAKSVSSRAEIVLTIMLLLTSAIIGPATRYEDPLGFQSVPVIYMFTVGLPNAGKSPAFAKVFVEVVAQLTKDGLVSEIFGSSFTHSGVIAKLRANDGHLSMIADEICSELLLLFNSKNAESMSFKRGLNNMFFGQPFDRNYGSKASVNVPETYIVIGGTAQPHVFINFLESLLVQQDGFVDRLFCHSANLMVDEAEILQQGFTKNGNWLIRLFSDIAKVHKNQKKVYEFDNDAIEFLTSLRAEFNESQATAVRDFQADLDANDVTVVPNLCGDTKDVDMTQRIAVLLQILTFSLTEFAKHGSPVTIADIPTLIPNHIVQKARKLVISMRMQMEVYKSAVEVAMKRKFELSLSAQDVVSLSSVDPLYTLFQIPGKVVTVKQITRKERPPKGHKAAVVIEALKEASGTSTDANFLGIVKKHGNQYRFYKAPPQAISKDELEKHGISFVDYERRFSSNVGKPPVKIGISDDDWDKMYKTWINEAPEEIKEMWAQHQEETPGFSGTRQN